MGKAARLSLDDIKKAKAEAEAKLKELAKAEADFASNRLKELRGEVEALLAKDGFTITDLLDGKGGRKAAKAKAPAKYKHPENASVTWSGRGRQPQWFKDHVNGGGKAEDLAI